MQEMDREICEDIVIVGFGISGLATALALHTYIITILEVGNSEPGIRIIPKIENHWVCLTLWTNAGGALDSLGIGDLVRETCLQMQGFLHVSADKSQFISEQSPFQPNKTDVKLKLESRCVKRKDLLETMEREWPQGTNRYSSKVVPVKE